MLPIVLALLSALGFAAAAIFARVGLQETFFLPFADTTSGKESDSAGRCLDVVTTGPDSFLIDFNYAYNPYCAYNPHWSCPIPPANRLKLPIRAGEKKYPGAV